MSASKKYLVKNGLDYKVKGKDVRREIGDEVDDLPPKSLDWLLDRGHVVLIEPIEDEES